jgi:hypothetical protein
MMPRTRSRLVLVFLAVLFLAPVLGATLLHWSGWEPGRTRNHGELLRPALDLHDAQLRRADGAPYAWEPEARRWRIAVVPTADCPAGCRELLAGLDKVWRLQGRHADRLDVLWFGPLPEGATPFRRLVPMQRDAAFEARLPQLATHGAPSAYLIDPAGYLALRYAPGFDVAHLREDVAQLLKH